MQEGCLTSETVQGSSLSLQGIDDVHGGDGLSSGVLGVGDGISDDVLQEDLEDTSGLLVDEAGDTLDTTPSRQPSDGGLGDTLDVVPQHLPVTLGATLSEALSSLSSSGHVVCCFFLLLACVCDEAFVFLSAAFPSRARPFPRPSSRPVFFRKRRLRFRFLISVNFGFVSRSKSASAKREKGRATPN